MVTFDRGFVKGTLSARKAFWGLQERPFGRLLGMVCWCYRLCWLSGLFLINNMCRIARYEAGAILQIDGALRGNSLFVVPPVPLQQLPKGRTDWGATAYG